MVEIYYNEDGWICNIPPYYVEKTEKAKLVDVSPVLFSRVRVCHGGNFWKYINGDIVECPYKKVELSIAEQIAKLKTNLINTDYQAIKYAEGQISEQEYAPIRKQRADWRDEINRLEAQ